MSSGMAVPFGVGAAASHAASSAAISGGLHTVSEVRSASGDPDADRLAEALGRRIAGFAASQGRIPPLPTR
jgi:hypothetical protein